MCPGPGTVALDALEGGVICWRSETFRPCRSKLRHTKVAGLEEPVTDVVEGMGMMLLTARTWTRWPDLSQNINDAPQLRLYSTQT